MPRVTHGHLPSQSGRITMAAAAMRARSKSVCLSFVSASSMNGTLETHSISQPFTRKCITVIACAGDIVQSAPTTMRRNSVSSA